MRRLISISCVLLSLTTTIGQTILIGDSSPDDFSKIDNDFGPNRKLYIYNYLGAGLKSKTLKLDNENYTPLKSNFDIKFGNRIRIGLGKVIGLIYDI